MVIDSMFPRCCESCIHGDSNTTWCHLMDLFMSTDYYQGKIECKLYESVHETINKVGCPNCGGYNCIFEDTDEGYGTASIECNDCGWAIFGSNRNDVLQKWLNRD